MGRAKTSLAFLLLDRMDLINQADYIDTLAEAIDIGTQFIIDNEVPVCDYT